MDDLLLFGKNKKQVYAIDTKSSESQYKLLNGILPFNDFLFKIGNCESPLCTFCHSTEENMPYLLFSLLETRSHGIG